MNKGVLNNSVPMRPTQAVSGGSIGDTMRAMMTPKNILIIVSLLIIVGVAVYYYFYVISPRIQTKFRDHSTLQEEAKKMGAGGKGDAEIILFHVDWCPHCKTAKPEWDSVSNEYDGKDVNGYTLQFTEVNCTEESPEIQEMIEKYNIEGYPTIKLIKGDQVIDFEAKPTKDTLTQFIKTVLN